MNVTISNFRDIPRTGLEMEPEFPAFAGSFIRAKNLGQGANPANNGICAWGNPERN